MTAGCAADKPAKQDGDRMKTSGSFIAAAIVDDPAFGCGTRLGFSSPGQACRSGDLKVHDSINRKEINRPGFRGGRLVMK